MNTEWRIVQGVYGLAVQTTDENAAWPLFFTAAQPEKYPFILETVADEVGFSNNGTGVIFPANLDDFDRLTAFIPVDAVEIYAPGYDDSIIPRATFYTVLEAFAERLLASPDRPAAWYEAMRAALAKLRVKMAADAAIG
jgi:hypothetical protein